MTVKRALVVDDSRSARAFLAKLLEDQALEVDAAETAEQALDYLTRNRPDVIFMDHLMPGMDGFQAVQAIKSNPRTATIPILMYTSQEGELYLGQARALGALGVLPKHVEPADVRTVLQQLHLVAQQEAQTVAAQPEVLEAAEAAAAAVDTRAETAAHIGPPVEELLRDEIAGLRRYVADSLESQSQRLLAEVRSAIREATPPPVVHEPPRRVLPWLVALAAGLAAVALGTLWWQERSHGESLQAELADTRATVTELSARIAAPPAASPATRTLAAGEQLTVVKVPFGEAPFAGARIEQLRSVVSSLVAAGVKGTLEVRRFVGRFCLAGTGGEGYSLADAAVPYIKCDLVADANDPALGNAVPESVAFANALAELRKQHGALLSIDVGEGRNDSPGTPYPEIGGTPPRVPTAGEWNTAAEANNRVEMRWHPAT